MRDLLVTPYTPVLRSGRALRTYGVARALASHRGLDLLYVRFDGTAPDHSFQSIPGIVLHEVVPSRSVTRAGAYLRARLAGVPPAFARGVSAELERAAERLAGQADRGRVITDGPIAAAALARLAGERPVIYNAHNLESAFRHELAGQRRELRGLRAFERRLLQRASEAWMVSDSDSDAARELCPNARLRLAPNVLDIAAIDPVASVAELPRAVFVANFAYEPNRRALRFLLEDVMVRVWRELPQAQLALVGAGLERPPSDDPRVQTLGFVDDLQSVYASSRCAVVPLLQGGGSPLKLIEALAYGLATVATPRAAAGLQVNDGEHLLLADGGEAFAAALLALLRDGAPQLGQAGRRLVSERYSIESLARLLAPEDSRPAAADKARADGASPA